MEKLNNKTELLKIAYKIICEIILLLSVSLFLLLVAEVILPGFISSLLNLGYILMLLLFLFIFVIAIGKKLDVNFISNDIKSRKYHWWFFPIFSIIIFISLLKFGITLAIIITSVTLIAVYYLFRIITDEK